MRNGPLTGIRVLDLTNVLAGPYCTYQLALLGADVVKIEPPARGDLARQLGADPDLNNRGLGTSFLAQNAGKKSIELDLKSTSGKESFIELLNDADVLVENFRPGVMERLSLSWPELKEINPQLVYCAISGFGQSGPMRDRPAYDQIIQGLSGMMSITGTPETAPLRVGFPICDTIGGLVAAMAINAALAGREHSGAGCVIDVSMLEASISAMGWAVSNYLISGIESGPMGDQNATSAPSGTFQASDGPLNIAANRQEQYVELCRIIDRLDLIDDERFHDREARKAHRLALNAELNGVLRSRTAIEWETELSAAGVPAARVLSLPETMSLEQLDVRGFFTDLPMPGKPERTVRVAGNGATFDGKPSTPHLPPPLLGEHSEELLGQTDDSASAAHGDLAAS
jgi:crotonobetainyl-CoA:carnitine CoA-transferase CaiB-like acyl-CoA transferase